MIATIKRVRPNAAITSDSVTVRRLVGRTNGKSGGPREVTKLQDDARALGLVDSMDVKAYALTLQGWGELARERAAAEALGWRDVELDDDNQPEPRAATPAPRRAPVQLEMFA